MSPTEPEKGLTLVLNTSVSMFPRSEEGQPKLVSLIFPFLLLLLLCIPNSYLASNLQRLRAHFSKRFRKPIRFPPDTKRGPVFHPHLTILQRPPGCRWCSQWHQWAAWHKSDPRSPCRHIPAGIHLPSHPLSGKPWKIKKKRRKRRDDQARSSFVTLHLEHRLQMEWGIFLCLRISEQCLGSREHWQS